MMMMMFSLLRTRRTKNVTENLRKAETKPLIDEDRALSGER